MRPWKEISPKKVHQNGPQHRIATNNTKCPKWGGNYYTWVQFASHVGRESSRKGRANFKTPTSSGLTPSSSKVFLTLPRQKSLCLHLHCSREEESEGAHFHSPEEWITPSTRWAETSREFGLRGPDETNLLVKLYHRECRHLILCKKMSAPYPLTQNESTGHQEENRKLGRPEECRLFF